MKCLLLTRFGFRQESFIAVHGLASRPVDSVTDLICNWKKPGACLSQCSESLQGYWDDYLNVPSATIFSITKYQMQYVLEWCSCPKGTYLAKYVDRQRQTSTQWKPTWGSRLTCDISLSPGARAGSSNWPWNSNRTELFKCFTQLWC